jgi:hypothetical protein
MDEKQKLIQKLDDARRALEKELAGAGPGAELYPGWTVKQLLAHIAGWDEVCTLALRAHAGQDVELPDTRDIEAFNTQAVAARQTMTAAQVVEEWKTARAEFKTAIDEIPESQLEDKILWTWGQRGTIAQAVDVFAEHELEHAHEIQEALGAGRVESEP